MILYPTETLYALGVNAHDPKDLAKLYKLKDRDPQKPASWLVRDVADIDRWAMVPGKAAKIAQQFLPGSLTLVLQGVDELPDEVLAPDRTAAFRISSDVHAQKLIEEWMAEFDAPLTCTSANVSGAPTLPTPEEILQQFGPRAKMIDRIIDDGPRKSLASTIVRVIGDDIAILREGNVTQREIEDCLKI